MGQAKPRLLPVGVSLCNGQFRACVRVNCRTVWLGRFATLAEAVAARVQAEQAHGIVSRDARRGWSLEQRQAEAQRGWLTGGAERDAWSSSRALYCEHVRAAQRRHDGWCARHAAELPVGTRRPNDCAECRPSLRPGGDRSYRVAPQARTGPPEARDRSRVGRGPKRR